MSLRRAEYARLQAAGWTVSTDSPWQRLAATIIRLVRLPVDTDTSTVGLLPGAGGGWSR